MKSQRTQGNVFMKVSSADSIHVEYYCGLSKDNWESIKQVHSIFSKTFASALRKLYGESPS